MRKGLLLVALSGLLTLLAGIPAGALELFYDGAVHNYEGNIFKLKINGDLVATDVPPVVFNDRSVVPARAVFEKLGATVGWEESQSLVTVSLDGTVITMQANNKNAYINGAQYVMDIAPKIINDRVMIPARFVSEQLGMDVDFDSTTDTILIDQPAIQSAHYTVGGVETEQNGDVLTVRIRGDHEGAVTTDFTMDGPPRIVLDISNAELGIDEREIAVGIQNVQRIRLGDSENRVRVVVDISKHAGYTVRALGTDVYIDVNLAGNSAPTATPKPETPSTGASVLNRVTVTKGSGGDIISTSLSADAPGVLTGPVAVEFYVYGDVPQKAEERMVSGSIVTKMQYTPIREGNGKVTLLIKGGMVTVEQDTGSDVFTLVVKPKKAQSRKAVVLDPGHGGSDPGAQGKDANGNVLASEKDINLDVALRTRDILQAAGVEVLMTRDTDTFIELYDIPEIGNETEAPLFVSIHTNSVDGIPGANGIEVWGYPKGSGSERDGMTSARLSELLLDSVVEATGATDRGVKNGQNLVVVRLTEMPAALVEVGFITNEEERSRLMDPAYRQKLAQGIADGILAAFKEMGL